MAVKKRKTRRARGTDSLYKRADGMWIGAVNLPPTEDGKRRRLTISSRDYATAVEELRKLQNKIADGDVPVVGNTSVEKWLKKWLDEIRGPHVKPGTYTWYERAIRLYINPHIGKKRVDRVTAEDVRKMIKKLQDGGSSRNAQKAHQTLHTALKDAKREGIVSKNVVESVRKPKHTPAEQEVFTADQARHLVATAVDIDSQRKEPKLASRWAAGLFTGARMAELLGLTWERVDLDKATIDISWQLQPLKQEHGCEGTCGKKYGAACPRKKWRVPPGFVMKHCQGRLAWTRPKSDAGQRIVPLTPYMVTTLRAHQAADNGDNPHNLVWHFRDGRPITQEVDHDEWAKLLKAAGVEHTHQHGLRHSMATLLQGAGTDQDTRMKIMGHSSVAAQNAYIHVALEPARRAINQLDVLIAPDSSKPDE